LPSPFDAVVQLKNAQAEEAYRVFTTKRLLRIDVDEEFLVKGADAPDAVSHDRQPSPSSFPGGRLSMEVIASDYHDRSVEQPVEDPVGEAANEDATSVAMNYGVGLRRCHRALDSSANGIKKLFAQPRAFGLVPLVRSSQVGDGLGPQQIGRHLLGPNLLQRFVPGQAVRSITLELIKPLVEVASLLLRERQGNGISAK
jgi:hypothetical protein